MRRAAFVLLVTLAAVSLRAQNQTTFRTGTNFVRVDMYATRDGKLIEDLQAGEVELLEDGVPQTIDSFEHVRIQPPGPQDARVEPKTVAQSRDMAAVARGRVFVIFLDTYHTQIEGSSNMRLPLVKFIDRVIGQEDMVAVMTPEMSVKQITFGRKTTVISNIMQNEWSWGRRGQITQDPKEDLYDACYPAVSNNNPGPAPEMKARRREKLTLDALDDLVAYLGGLREERKAILTVSEGWMLFRENHNLAGRSGRDQVSVVDRLLRRPTKEKTAEGTGGTKDVNHVECEADRTVLATLDHSMRLRTLTEEANRGNVTFYSIYARGLAVFDAPIGPDKPPSPTRDVANLSSRQDSLRFVADNTDGAWVVNTSNIDPLIARIVDDLSSYYLLGYVSSNTKLDGRFRSITVRVKRDGVKVRARRGYRGPTAGELVSSTSRTGTTDKPAATAVPSSSTNPRAPFRIRTSTWVQSSPENSRQGAFWIVGELDYQTRRQLAWTAGAQAEVVVLDAGGKEVLTRTVDLKPEEGPFSIQVPETGAIAAGEYAVRVRMRSQADDKTELTDTARVILNDRSALGEAVMWRRGLSTGPRYLRTADPRFTRSDRLKLELATTAPTQATARILDRNRNELSVPAQVSERADASGAFRWIVVDATLAPFAAGDYSVEVTQGSDKRVTEFKVVP